MTRWHEYREDEWELLDTQDGAFLVVVKREVTTTGTQYRASVRGTQRRCATLQAEQQWAERKAATPNAAPSP